MKVSIMVTCYNSEDTIEQAIMSVFLQRMNFSWELLVGDDGSSDSTIEIVKKLLNKYPQNTKLFVMERSESTAKSGTRAARNRANLLEHATGEYLIFLDGDDEFTDAHKIQKQVELLDSNKYKSCSCSAHNIVANVLGKNIQYEMVDNKISSGIINSLDYFKNIYFHTDTILFRSRCKETLLQSNYRDYLNDNFITFLIIQHGPIIYINESMAQYNITGHGLWTGKKRTYGCFRNIMLYDLERQVNPSFRKVSFHRHLYDFMYLFKNYTDDSDEDINELIKGLDKDKFQTTYLLAKISNISRQQRLKKARLFLKANAINIWLHLRRINIYATKYFNIITNRNSSDKNS